MGVRRRVRRLLVPLLITTFGVGIVGATSCTPPPPQVTFTYSVRTLGPVLTSQRDFAGQVAHILTDGRSWSDYGRIAFKQVASGGNFTVWLASSNYVPTFSSGCDATWNCTVGNDVIANDARWEYGSPTGLRMNLFDYRALIINHESGHWLGLPHWGCPGPGAAAPVMMQQSIYIGACRPNPWPTAAEIATVNNLHHVHSTALLRARYEGAE